VCVRVLFVHPRYNMLLNLLRVEGANPEQMMALSFHQFQNEQAAPALEALMAEKEAEREGIEVAEEADVEQCVPQLMPLAVGVSSLSLFVRACIRA
jgi:ATP-dependent RNA helicase DOB1